MSSDEWLKLQLQYHVAVISCDRNDIAEMSDYNCNNGKSWQCKLIMELINLMKIEKFKIVVTIGESVKFEINMQMVNLVITGS